MLIDYNNSFLTTLKLPWDKKFDLSGFNNRHLKPLSHTYNLITVANRSDRTDRYIQVKYFVKMNG